MMVWIDEANATNEIINLGASKPAGLLYSLLKYRSIGLELVCRDVTRYAVTRYMEVVMALPAARMKAMRERRSARGLRELRLVVPDARSKSVRKRVAKQVAGLDRSRELDALSWIEAVSVFDGQ